MKKKRLIINRGITVALTVVIATIEMRLLGDSPIGIDNEIYSILCGYHDVGLAMLPPHLLN